MSRITLVIFTLLLSACTSTPPPPPEPSGDKTPVNPEKIYLNELEIGK